MNPMRLAVLCDFDGTITTIDTAEWILKKFAAGDWHQFDKQFEKGQITLEKCLNKQFSLVSITKGRILQELKNIVVFRPGFKNLAEYCKENRIPFVVVSAGLDFVINYFLKTNSCLNLVEVCTAKTEFICNHVKFTFPSLRDRRSNNIKDDLVKRYKSQDEKVMYLGDGLADFPAAREADYAFAIEGSRLSSLFTEHGIRCAGFTDFNEIIYELRGINTTIGPDS